MPKLTNPVPADAEVEREVVPSLDRMECVTPVQILVIDDDEMTCTVIRDALTHEDFHIRTVSNVAEVEPAIRQAGPIHLIVLDYVLPGLSIEQVLTWINELQPEPALVVISGYPTIEAVQTALRARAYDYITKPFALVQFRETVVCCLKSRGLMRMTREALRETVGAVIRERRIELDLTLTDMVKRTGISLGYLSQIELGKNSASVDTLYRVSLALGLKLSELFQVVQRHGT